MLRIESVAPGSYAAEMGLQVGDRLLSINGHEMSDLIDYHRGIETDHLLLEVLRDADEIWEFELEKEPQEDIGLDVEHPHPQHCGNQCLFCFVHQLPKGLRNSLYVKDEDYRFSYLYGSYITLTNLQEPDLKRIIEQQLSPLYVSVHATDPELRDKLLGCSVPEILPLLKRLAAGGIILHCQVVLCPAVNDGKALIRTIEDLAELFPQVASLAVVPVGLTRHRETLPRLSKMTRQDASVCLDIIHQYQQDYLTRKGSRFVFAADEIYLLAEQDIPALADYEDFPQLENGVGMIAQFRQQAQEVLLEAEPLDAGKIILVTGSSFCHELEQFASRLSLRTGVKLEVVAINNDFFGSSVTVAGLITGKDLLQQLQGRVSGDGVLLPDVMLKENEQLFLDDMTIEKIGAALGMPIISVEPSPWGILDGLERFSGQPIDIIHCQGLS